MLDFIFTDKEMGAQRGHAISPGSHSWKKWPSQFWTRQSLSIMCFKPLICAIQRTSVSHKFISVWLLGILNYSNTYFGLHTLVKKPLYTTQSESLRNAQAFSPGLGSLIMTFLKYSIVLAKHYIVLSLSKHLENKTKQIRNRKEDVCMLLMRHNPSCRGPEICQKLINSSRAWQT